MKGHILEMSKQPTDEQKNIINYNGNMVITAKPGSGKTYTIVEKAAEILRVSPEHKGIIAISFTNKASDELKRRCKDRCDNTKQSFFGTIDKFYISQIILPFASHVTGRMMEYEIINEIDQNGDYGLLAEHTDCLSKEQENLLVKGLFDGKIFLKYTGETALFLLNNVKGVLLYLKAKYTHIIIDEYQDCGFLQDSIFLKLVENGLMGIAVGDIDQAIYGFNGRFPKYLIALISRTDFKHFELTKNHRCHPSISEYSLCLLGIKKEISKDKRVIKINVNGDERDICKAIDKYLEDIKGKYRVDYNKQIAILCKTNKNVIRINNYLETPHKVFTETELDYDNTDTARFFRDLLFSCFDDHVYVTDYTDKLFSEEYEPMKYRKALKLVNRIFSCSFAEFYKAENDILELTKMVECKNITRTLTGMLHSIINDQDKLKNFVPASNNEVNIMTMHKAKGLEFNIVFHMDLYKWIMPGERDDDNGQDLNLHYVTITRAIDVCYFMNGTRRYRSYKDDYIDTVPSPFLDVDGLAERRREATWTI